MSNKTNKRATPAGSASDKDEKILAALIANSTVRGASEACGISETVIYGRLRDEVFRQRYDNARYELLDTATAMIQKKIMAAIDVISEIAENKETSPQIRLNAATAILQHAVKMTDYACTMKVQQRQEAARLAVVAIDEMTPDEIEKIRSKINKGVATVLEAEMCAAATMRMDNAESKISDSKINSLTNIF